MTGRRAAEFFGDVDIDREYRSWKGSLFPKVMNENIKTIKDILENAKNFLNLDCFNFNESLLKKK